MRRILHIDMDAFFAAVEQTRRPELAGKAVVVGGEGDPTKRGVVSTASYEARKFGIGSAMPLRTAYKLCPNAIFLPVDYGEYSRVSSIIKNILREVTPLMEDVGIDEAFLDISEIPKSPDAISSGIKGKIRDETGLTCSIGVSFNKLLAKIASDMEKPDGFTLITQDDIASRIWPLKVRKLRGVGPKTEEYLNRMGIKTIGALAALSIETLVGEFGRSYGEYLFHAAKGADDDPLVTCWEPKSSSRETTFQYDTDNWQAIAKTLAGLTKEAVEDMKMHGYHARTVTVKVRFQDFKSLTRAKTLPVPTASLEEIRRAAFLCLGRVELKKRVRLIGVKLTLHKVEGSGE